MKKKFMVYSLWCIAKKRKCYFFFFFILFSINSQLSTINSYADTVYMKDGATQKGLVVEEYYDRFVFNTEDGEKEILKSNIDEIFFSEPYWNNLYLGKKFEKEDDFDSALRFYRLALQADPDFGIAEDAIKGLEDAKWRFKKSWRYRELREMLNVQLGMFLKRDKEKIVVKKIGPARQDILKGDVLIRCWAEPLTYADLKNATKVLIGLSNTILKLVVEREIEIETTQTMKLFRPFAVSMEVEGPTIRTIKEDSATYRSGLRQGDLIVKINDRSTRYMKLGEMKRRLFGKAKEKLLTIRRGITLMRKREETNGTKRAMWVWHSKEVLLDDARKKVLLKFCKEKNIGTLFFQLQYQFVPYEGQTACKLLHETKLKSFLKDAHSQDIKVHMLDGSPTFCLENEHGLVLAQLRAILDFNSKAAPLERVDGVHYDNEPYLLTGFNSNLKEDIIKQFLLLNQKCRKLIDSSSIKLEFGIDIPFWFDQLGRLDQKLIDICDNVGIMDYRNFASGPDGIVNRALATLKYSSSVGKKVFVGVETSKYPLQEVYIVSIVPEDKLNKIIEEKKGALDLAGQNRFEGFGLRLHTSDKKMYVGLVKPEGAEGEAFKQALFKLGDIFGRVERPDEKAQYDELSFDVQYNLSKNPEFRDTQAEEYTTEGENIYLVFKAKEVMLEKLTFADSTEKDLESVLAEAAREFRNFPAFAGFAIHHYKSYKALCNKK